MILFGWQLEPQDNGETVSIVRANGILMFEDRTIVLGTFPGSILLIPTLHAAAGCLANMRVPAGPLRFELVGDSPVVSLTVDARCEARLSYRETVIRCDGRELMHEFVRASVGALHAAGGSDTETTDLVGFFTHLDTMFPKRLKKAR